MRREMPASHQQVGVSGIPGMSRKSVLKSSKKTGCSLVSGLGLQVGALQFCLHETQGSLTIYMIEMLTSSALFLKLSAEPRSVYASDKLVAFFF